MNCLIILFLSQKKERKRGLLFYNPTISRLHTISLELRDESFNFWTYEKDLYKIAKGNYESDFTSLDFL